MSDVWMDRIPALSDDDLLEKLGQLLITDRFVDGLVRDEEFGPDIAIGLQAHEQLRQLGHKILLRVSREMYELICGSAASEKQERSIILHATGLSDAVITAALVTLLSSFFDFSSAVCAALATLILRRIIKPAGDEVCKFWREHYV